MNPDHIFEAMMANKPTRRYIADVVELPNGKFNAIWAIPGLVPDYVYDIDRGGNRTKTRTVFNSKEDAVNSAVKIGWIALERRAEIKIESRRKYITQPVPPEILAEKMGQAGLSPSDLAILKATSLERVIGWLDGEQDAPADLWGYLEVLTKFEDQDAVELAIEAIAAKSSVKPQYAEYERRVELLKTLISQVGGQLNSKNEHRNRFEAALSSESELTLSEKIAELTAIAHEIGLAIDDHGITTYVGETDERCKELIEAIEDIIPEATRVANVWAKEHPDTRNPFSSAIRSFQKINNSPSKYSPNNLDALEMIAGQLGLGMDVNAWIEEQNLPYRKEIEEKQRTQKSRERAIKKSLKPKWVDPWRAQD